MKGRFTYYNQPLVILIALSGAVITGILMKFYSLFAIPSLFLTIILIIALGQIPGYYQANHERVRFKILWRTCSFAYSEIQSVTTEIHYGGKSRFDDTFTVVAELTLRTDNGVHIFRSRHAFSISDQIKAPERFKKQLDTLDFIQLGRYIEAQIG